MDNCRQSHLKEGFERDIVVERSVLISRCRPDGGQDTIADTYLSISRKAVPFWGTYSRMAFSSPTMPS